MVEIDENRNFYRQVLQSNLKHLSIRFNKSLKRFDSLHWLQFVEELIIYAYDPTETDYNSSPVLTSSFSLPIVEKISWTNCVLDKNCFQFLGQCPSLKEVLCEDTTIHPSYYNLLSTQPSSLVTINQPISHISRWNIYTNQQVIPFFEQYSAVFYPYSAITSLTLEFTKITALITKDIQPLWSQFLTHFPQLASLVLTNFNFETDIGEVFSFFRPFAAHLQELILDSTTWIPRLEIKNNETFLQNLQSLSLRYLPIEMCMDVIDYLYDTIQQIHSESSSPSSHPLQCLKIYGYIRFQVETYQYLVDRCPNLDDLEVVGRKLYVTQEDPDLEQILLSIPNVLIRESNLLHKILFIKGKYVQICENVSTGSTDEQVHCAM
jgi:hypothetical protein